MTLATNTAGVQSHKSTQRRPNEAELALTQKIAMAEFRKLGAPDSAISSIAPIRLFVSELSRGSEFLIGTLDLTLGETRHTAFLIATFRSTVELIHHDNSSDPDGKDSIRERFVDQLDLDHDGVDEVVTDLTDYESEASVIYKRQGAAWVEVWSGGEGAARLVQL
jgi:hypothetical protein